MLIFPFLIVMNFNILISLFIRVILNFQLLIIRINNSILQYILIIHLFQLFIYIVFEFLSLRRIFFILNYKLYPNFKEVLLEVYFLVLLFLIRIILINILIFIILIRELILFSNRNHDFMSYLLKI